MSRRPNPIDPKVTQPVALSTVVSADARRQIEQATREHNLSIRQVIEIAVESRFGPEAKAS